jgi:hypothetical protein
MALRALNSVIAANYNKEATDPMLAGDILMMSTDTTLGTTVNPSCVVRAQRSTAAGGAGVRGNVIGVCADDGLGTNPAGEFPTMINNDPAGSNFVNGSVFQSYTAGFYVGVKRAIGDFKDETIEFVSNLSNVTSSGLPTYAQRGVSVYTTPSSQFVSDRFVLLTAASTQSGSVNGSASDDTTAWVPAAGDLLTVGSSNGNAGYAGTPTSPSAGLSSTNNRGLLVKYVSSGPVLGRVDFYDSGAGLLYWTLL